MRTKNNSVLLVSSTIVLVLMFLLVRIIWSEALSEENQILNALIGGSVAAAATALGTLPILFSKKLDDKVTDSMLGFGAGVMLAATMFSLILPGMNSLGERGAGAWESSLIMGGAILLGALLMMLLEYIIPHEHLFIGKIHNNNDTKLLRRTWLFVFAICLHNFPEGLAIGVGFAGAGTVAGSALATGIAIQDIPEGLVVSLALLNAGYHKKTCVLIGILSGLIEPIGAVLGAAIVGLFEPLLPWGLGFAAGAMLFVISHEVIPESHRKGHEKYATTGLMIGFVLMMVLDTALG